jgi:hypothetical protein
MEQSKSRVLSKRFVVNAIAALLLFVVAVVDDEIMSIKVHGARGTLDGTIPWIGLVVFAKNFGHYYYYYEWLMVSHCWKIDGLIIHRQVPFR